MQAIVGLGGSAGSIGALKTFFSHMPGDSGHAFVVVLHLSPAYESRLAGVLQKYTPMPVIQVSGPIKVEANCVYVIPPGKQVLTDN
jgi:two-component system CheB/CheR fusion protein